MVCRQRRCLHIHNSSVSLPRYGTVDSLTSVCHHVGRISRCSESRSTGSLFRAAYRILCYISQMLYSIHNADSLFEVSSAHHSCHFFRRSSAGEIFRHMFLPIKVWSLPTELKRKSSLILISVKFCFREMSDVAQAKLMGFVVSCLRLFNLINFILSLLNLIWMVC